VPVRARLDVNAKDSDGRTALIQAAWHNQNPEVVGVLVQAGAERKAKDNSGKTAFDYAQGNPKLQGTDAYRMLDEASR